MRSKKNGVIAEGDILKRLETGDPLALEMIWDRHSCDLLGYLMSILCSRTDAEDILQEVMVSIAQKHTVVARTDTLRPYLFRMARNHALNLLKRRRYEPVASTYADCWLIARESDGDDLVKYNQRPVQGPGDPHGQDASQWLRTAEYLNHYFYGMKMSEATETWLNSDPFNPNVSNNRTQTPYDFYYGGFNTVTGGTGGVDGRNGWYYYTLPDAAGRTE
jgi:RNA polymerase sigma factor (sigma-70 family)